MCSSGSCECWRSTKFQKLSHDIHIDTKRIVLAYSFTTNYETLHLILIIYIVFLE